MVIGCGSIGTIHAKNLKSLGVKDIVISDPIDSKLKSLGTKIRSNLRYHDYKQAVKENSDIVAALICTPTAFHMDTAIYLAKKKINLFIEKPLSNNLKKTNILSKIVSKNKLIVMMGHSYMFDIGFLKLKSLLDKNIIGKIYFVTYFQGQYLPDWHSGEDYRTEYTANKSLGGGVLLTLTSHTFYVIEWLFGQVESIHGSLLDKVGSLEVDVDDCVFLLLKMKNNIIVQTQNNFLVRVYNHKIVIEGEKGMLEYDRERKKIGIFIFNKKSKLIQAGEANNARFVKEMKYFLKGLKQNSIDNNLGLQSGIRFLKVVHNLKKRI